MCCALAAACADNLQVPDTNVTPVAVARILNDDRKDPSVTLSGASVTVMLDGSRSRDPDGSIRTYRWLSATTRGDGELDAGASRGGRWVPDGASPDWPDDVMQPPVTLPAAGDYAFTLWVIDDRGHISDPSTISLRVVRE